MGRISIKHSLLCAMAAAVLATGCFDADSPMVQPPTTTVSVIPTPQPPTQGGVAQPAPPPTATTAAVVPPVGSRERLAAQIEHAWVESSGGYAVDLGEVPIPDLTNPDPLVAVGELYRFNSWLLEHAAAPEWAEVIAMRAGHAYVDLRLVHEAFRFKRLEYTGAQVFDAAGLEVIGEPDGVGVVPREVAAGAPAGSVAVSYETSTGPYRSVGSDGVIYQEFPRFDLVITVVLSPTESGWKIFWEER